MHYAPNSILLCLHGSSVELLFALAVFRAFDIAEAACCVEPLAVLIAISIPFNTVASVGGQVPSLASWLYCEEGSEFVLGGVR